MQVEAWMNEFRQQGYAEPDVVTWARGQMPDFDDRMRAERAYWFDGEAWQYADPSLEGQEDLTFAISSEQPPEEPAAVPAADAATAEAPAQPQVDTMSRPFKFCGANLILYDYVIKATRRGYAACIPAISCSFFKLAQSQSCYFHAA